MDNFEWNTDEDSWHDEPVPEKLDGHGTAHRWQRWGFFTIALLMVAFGGWLLLQQARQQVVVATESSEDNVRSSFNLVYSSARNGDRELFSNVLSGSDREWTVVQQLLVGSGDLFARDVFGLRIQPDEPDIVDLALAPDLRSAVITATVPYAVDVGNGVTRTVGLNHVSVYRLGETRWLYSPPVAASFWGEFNNVLRGQYISVRYPTRDEMFARALAPYLNDQVRELCRLAADGECALRPRTVILSTDPATLLDTDWLNLNIPDVEPLILPAPTLVGSPADAAAQQALLRGYARQVLYPTLANLVEYECCDHIAFFEALANRYLAEIAVLPWPPTAADWSAVAALDQITLSSSHPVWQAEAIDTLTEAERHWAHMVVQWLVEQELSESDALTTYELLTSLSGTTQSIWGWIYAVEDPDATGRDMSRAALGRRWLSYVDRATWLAEPPPTPLPSDTIYAACQREGGASELLRYDWSAATWESRLRRDDASLFIATLPDGRLWINEQPYNSDRIALHVVERDGTLRTIVALPDAGSLLYWGLAAPGGDKLVVFDINAQAAGRLTPFALVDTARCLAGDCSATPLDGVPEWAPDGAHAIILAPPDFTAGDRATRGAVMLANGAGETIRPLGAGDDLNQTILDVAWVSSTTFVATESYRPTNDSEATERLVVGTIDQADLTPLVELTALIEQFESLTQPFLRIGSLIRDPSTPDSVLLTVLPLPNRALAGEAPFADVPDDIEDFTALVRVGVNTGAIEIVETFDQRLSFDLDWLEFDQGPVPTQLTLYGGDRASRLLYDLESGRLQTVGDITLADRNWSTDGAWRVGLGPEYVRLLAPEFDYEDRLYLAYTSCIAVVMLPGDD